MINIIWRPLKDNCEEERGARRQGQGEPMWLRCGLLPGLIRAMCTESMGGGLLAEYRYEKFYRSVGLTPRLCYDQMNFIALSHLISC